MLWDSRSYWNLLSSLIWGQCSARESGVTLHLVSADTELGGAPCYRRARAEAAVLTPHEASTGTLLAWQRGSALFQLSTWSLLTPQWGGSLVTVNIKVLSLHQATASQIPEGRGEGALRLLGRDEKSAPCWQAVKLGCACYGLVKVEVRACPSVFSGVGLDDTTVFPLMSG